MSSVGQRAEHAGQTTITLTGLHAHFGKARAALMRVSALHQGWVAQAAEQLITHRLEFRLRPSQTRSRRYCSAPNLSASRK